MEIDINPDPKIDINTASKDELVSISGIGEEIANAIIDGRPFHTIEEATRISGIGKHRLEDLVQQGLTVGPVDADDLREYADLSILEAPVSEFMATDSPTIASDASVEEAHRQFAESRREPLVVVDDSDRVAGLLEERYLGRAGDAGEPLPFRRVDPRSSFFIGPDATAAEATERLLARGFDRLLVSDPDVGFQGLVRLDDLEPVTRTAFYHMCASTLVASSGGEEARTPPEDLSVADDCECSILIFSSRGSALSRMIDLLTGGYGYSHVAIDCCERDPETGETVIIEAVQEGVKRSYLSSYGDRPYVRIPLAPHGVDCEEFCRCVEGHVGEPYDFGEAITGTDRDTGKQICSGLAFDCLPADVRRAIMDHKGEEDGTGHPHPRVSPNDLARFFGAPSAENLTSGEVVRPDEQETEPPYCHVTIELVEVRYAGGYIGNDWSLEVRMPQPKGLSKGSGGKGGKHTYSRTFDTSSPAHIGEVVYEDNMETCEETLELYVSVTASEVDPGPDDTDSGHDPFEIDCETHRTEEITVSPTEDYFFGTGSTAQITFVFDVAADCVTN